jgi:flagellar hook protein FlgE
MGFFGVPLSGLVASESALNAVSNNLANLNTTGYKDQNATFSDVFAQSSLLNGVGNPLQQGLGVKVSQLDSNFTDGAQTATGVSSNMALAGNGLFVTQAKNGNTDYTRAGDFTTNAQGQLVTPSGNLVMGYPAVNGKVSTTSTLQPLVINQGTELPASATTTFNLGVNLSAGATPGTTFSSTLPVYDSLGTQQQLSVTYTNTGANTWTYSVNMPTSATGATSTQVASGTLQFDSKGNLTSPTGSIAVTVPTLADGAAPLKLTWNLDDSAGNPTITQNSAASATTAATQDGYQSGTLTSYSVTSDGTIDGTFSNGQTMALGQVALANFANVQGLLQLGGNEYQATAASGTAIVGTAGTGGLGTITGGSVEGSNVDVATEFGKMIVAQQGYQANARSITTLNQLEQTTMQMLQG